MTSKLRRTALAFLEGFQTLSADTFLSALAPNAIHHFAPASLSPPPDMDPDTFAHHIAGLKRIMHGFPVYPKEIYENEGNNQVTVWATSLTLFRDEVQDNTFRDEEWDYRGEYIFIFTMDETQEKIVSTLEFLDSKGTERLREVISRAKLNLARQEAALKAY